MPESRGLALEYGHGRVHYVGYQYGPKVSQPFPVIDEARLAKILQDHRSGNNRLVLVQLDCPEENLTDQERAWTEISTEVLEERLGIPVRQVSDIHALVNGLSDPEEVFGALEYPYGAVILNDSDDPERGGFVRKYLVTGPDSWQPLTFSGQSQDKRVAHVGGPELLLSVSMPDVRAVIDKFIRDHPDVPRLVVWSPENLPIQRGSYNEFGPDDRVICRVTILNHCTFVLESASKQD